MTRATKKIDAARWYTLAEVVEEKLIPWASSYWSVKKMISAEHGGKNRLGVVAAGFGTNVRYQIKGSKIIKFIEGVRTGKISATTTSQKIWQTQQQH